jgi:biotin carboxylase
MRKALSDAGVSCPKFILADEFTDFRKELSSFSFPIIVKPTDRSGSRNITKLDSLDGIETAVRNACGTSFEGKAIIEEYLTGEEYSMETISYKGKHHFLAVTKKFTTGAPNFIETGHKQPSDLRPDIIERAKTIIFKALDALHVENSAGHSEFRVDDEGNIKIIEIGARMGGDCIGSDLVYLSTGHDFVKMVIDVACGNEPILNRNPSNSQAEIRFLFDQNDLDGFEELKKNHGEQIYRVSDFHLTNIGNVTDSSSRIGYYILIF